MPFTVSHVAAALPFRKARLVYSAVVVGTVAPDFEYFLRMAPQGIYGHTLPGVFTFTLPLALAVLWLFHRFVKCPLVQLLPESVGDRIDPSSERFQFGGARRFALIVGSTLVGIATHVAWDLFTHPIGWLYLHWGVLGQPVVISTLLTLPLYKLLQYGCSVLGLTILALSLRRGYRTSRPSESRTDQVLSPARKASTLALMMIVAVVGAFGRAWMRAGVPSFHPMNKAFVVVFIVAMIGLLWWELLIYGFISARTGTSSR
jgi:hypothetical protein